MVDPFDRLFDDRTLVEVGADKMGGRADQLDAALMRPVIGFCALEAGEEAVMDVDAATGQFRAEIVGQYLHIAGKDQIVGLSRVHHIQDSLFLFRAIAGGYRQMVERHVMPFGQVA